MDHSFVLIEVSDRVRIMAISFAVFFLIFLYYFFIRRKPEIANESKKKRLILGLLFGPLICLVLCGVVTWFVERGNVWFADKSKTRTERVYIKELTIREGYREGSRGRREKTIEYVTAISSPSGSGYIVNSEIKPSYFDYLQKGCYYNATVCDGFFGFTIITDFGKKISNP